MNQSVCCAVTTRLPVLSIHQISTLEKTKFYQRSTLSSLMSLRFQRVSRSVMLLSLRAQRRLTFVPGFPRAFTSSRR